MDIVDGWAGGIDIVGGSWVGSADIVDSWAGGADIVDGSWAGGADIVNGSWAGRVDIVDVMVDSVGLPKGGCTDFIGPI